MDWYLLAFKNYAVFDGRAHRTAYWMFALINIVISFALGFVCGILGLGAGLSATISVVYSLAVLIPGLAVAVRRLHDIGRSGWWILFPLVNLVFLCLDSQPGENEFGPNPKEA